MRAQLALSVMAMAIFFAAVKSVRWQLIALLCAGVAAWWFTLEPIGTYALTGFVAAVGHIEPEMRRLRRGARPRAQRPQATPAGAAVPTPGAEASSPRLSTVPWTASVRLAAALVVGVFALWLLATLFSMWIFRIPG